MTAWLKKHLFLNIVRLACIAAMAALLVFSRSGGEKRPLYFIVTFVFLFLPELVSFVLKVEPPDALSVVYVVMLFFANILGELIELYLSLSLWDAALHLIAGFFLALTGCSFVEIMSENSPKPLHTFLFALTFSVFIGLLWEFFEYFMDCVFRYDMQKDTIISHVSSILLDPNGTNTSVTEEIKSVVVNGAAWPGYIDVGLHDTMSDMLISTAGALVGAACCYINARSPKRFRFIRAFFMKKKQK